MLHMQMALTLFSCLTRKKKLFAFRQYLPFGCVAMLRRYSYESAADEIWSDGKRWSHNYLAFPNGRISLQVATYRICRVGAGYIALYISFHNRKID